MKEGFLSFIGEIRINENSINNFVEKYRDPNVSLEVNSIIELSHFVICFLFQREYDDIIMESSIKVLMIAIDVLSLMIYETNLEIVNQLSIILDSKCPFYMSLPGKNVYSQVCHYFIQKNGFETIIPSKESICVISVFLRVEFCRKSLLDFIFTEWVEIFSNNYQFMVEILNTSIEEDHSLVERVKSLYLEYCLSNHNECIEKSVIKCELLLDTISENPNFVSKPTILMICYLHQKSKIKIPYKVIKSLAICFKTNRDIFIEFSSIYFEILKDYMKNGIVFLEDVIPSYDHVFHKGIYSIISLFSLEDCDEISRHVFDLNDFSNDSNELLKFLLSDPKKQEEFLYKLKYLDNEFASLIFIEICDIDITGFLFANMNYKGALLLLFLYLKYVNNSKQSTNKKLIQLDETTIKKLLNYLDDPSFSEYALNILLEIPIQHFLIEELSPCTEDSADWFDILRLDNLHQALFRLNTLERIIATSSSIWFTRFVRTGGAIQIFDIIFYLINSLFINTQQREMVYKVGNQIAERSVNVLKGYSLKNFVNLLNDKSLNVIKLLVKYLGRYFDEQETSDLFSILVYPHNHEDSIIQEELLKVFSFLSPKVLHQYFSTIVMKKSFVSDFDLRAMEAFAKRSLNNEPYYMYVYNLFAHPDIRKCVSYYLKEPPPINFSSLTYICKTLMVFLKDCQDITYIRSIFEFVFCDFLSKLLYSCLPDAFYELIHFYLDCYYSTVVDIIEGFIEKDSLKNPGYMISSTKSIVQLKNFNHNHVFMFHLANFEEIANFSVSKELSNDSVISSFQQLCAVLHHLPLKEIDCEVFFKETHFSLKDTFKKIQSFLNSTIGTFGEPTPIVISSEKLMSYHKIVLLYDNIFMFRNSKIKFSLVKGDIHPTIIDYLTRESKDYIWYHNIHINGLSTVFSRVISEKSDKKNLFVRMVQYMEDDIDAFRVQCISNRIMLDIKESTEYSLFVINYPNVLNLLFSLNSDLRKCLLSVFLAAFSTVPNEKILIGFQYFLDVISSPSIFSNLDFSVFSEVFGLLCSMFDFAIEKPTGYFYRIVLFLKNLLQFDKENPDKKASYSLDLSNLFKLLLYNHNPSMNEYDLIIDLLDFKFIDFLMNSKEHISTFIKLVSKYIFNNKKLQNKILSVIEHDRVIASSIMAKYSLISMYTQDQFYSLRTRKLLDFVCLQEQIYITSFIEFYKSHLSVVLSIIEPSFLNDLSIFIDYFLICQYRAVRVSISQIIEEFLYVNASTFTTYKFVLYDAFLNSLPKLIKFNSKMINSSPDELGTMSIRDIIPEPEYYRLWLKIMESGQFDHEVSRDAKFFIDHALSYKKIGVMKTIPLTHFLFFLFKIVRSTNCVSFFNNCEYESLLKVMSSLYFKGPLTIPSSSLVLALLSLTPSSKLMCIFSSSMFSNCLLCGFGNKLAIEREFHYLILERVTDFKAEQLAEVLFKKSNITESINNCLLYYLDLCVDFIHMVPSSVSIIRDLGTIETIWAVVGPKLVNRNESKLFHDPNSINEPLFNILLSLISAYINYFPSNFHDRRSFFGKSYMEEFIEIWGNFNIDFSLLIDKGYSNDSQINGFFDFIYSMASISKEYSISIWNTMVKKGCFNRQLTYHLSVLYRKISHPVISCGIITPHKLVDLLIPVFMQSSTLFDDLNLLISQYLSNTNQASIISSALFDQLNGNDSLSVYGKGLICLVSTLRSMNELPYSQYMINKVHVLILNKLSSTAAEPNIYKIHISVEHLLLAFQFLSSFSDMCDFDKMFQEQSIEDFAKIHKTVYKNRLPKAMTRISIILSLFPIFQKETH